MKLLPCLVLSLFCSYTFANTELNPNTINIPSVEKNIPVVEKTTEVKRRADAPLNKNTEALKIASSAKRDFENKVKRAWQVPINSSGQQATARVSLSENGSVASVSINASDPEVKSSIERAIRAAAPYPMPSDPDARRQARSFSASFKVE
ncbi:cell envelope integrity protein TolA [Acinetobacter wuhouensis]|uniref:cell envelope integrity protein TolA n=1 Tax=Acinetobacter wuhouensis TaxID=1879050 RepID=UPI003872F3AB